MKSCLLAPRVAVLARILSCGRCRCRNDSLDGQTAIGAPGAIGTLETRPWRGRRASRIGDAAGVIDQTWMNSYRALQVREYRT